MGKKKADMQEKAKRSRDEYAYMDNMPLEGWIWEFVRRDQRFQSAFQTIKGVMAKFKVIPEPWPDEFRQAHDYIRSIVSVGPFNDRERPIPPKYLILSPKNRPARARKLPSYWRIRYPDPKARYCDFGSAGNGPECPKPFIWGTRPFVIREYSTLEENARNLADIKEAVKAQAREEPIDELDAIAALVRMASLEHLKIGESENTICIGISKKARMGEIENDLLPALAGFLNKKKPKIRDEKWKYYLVLYDLKSQNQKTSYEELTDSLQEEEMFPREDGWDQRTVEYDYKQALHLIHGEYKKYLYL